MWHPYLKKLLGKRLGKRPVYGSLTEGKTRGNIKPSIKVPPQRPVDGPPAPTPKFKRRKEQPRPDYFAPAHAIECSWIEVYVPNSKGVHDGCNIEHHDKVRFWIDQNGNLVEDGEATVILPFHDPAVPHELH